VSLSSFNVVSFGSFFSGTSSSSHEMVGLVTAITKLTVKFKELDSKVGQIADSIGHVVSDMINPWSVICTEDGSEKEGETLKDSILQYYGIKDNKCMIVGNVHWDDSKIINAHLWPNHTKGKGLTFFGLDNAEYSRPRNFLRLQKQIEYAFDHHQIVLDPIFESDSSFRLKIVVLYRKLLEVKTPLFRTVVGRKKKLCPIHMGEAQRAHV